jgi:glycosyltransferase involved in cell wall biosynthesis
MPASGRLIVSLPINEHPGQNEYHLHCFTAESARVLVSEFFDITHEYHQTNNVTFVAKPGRPLIRSDKEMTVVALLQVYGGKNGAYCSAAQEIVELRRAGMNVVVLCDDPRLVRVHTGSEAFLLPLESSFRGDGQVSPVHLSAACAFAQWFDADAIYAAHEFMPLARSMADVTTIPTVLHLRGLPSAGWYEGEVRPGDALPRSPRCQLVANSVTTADHYANALGCKLETFPVVPPRIDFAALRTHIDDVMQSEISAVAGRGPMMLFVASTRNTVKGFEQFLAMAELVEAFYPREFTFGIIADDGNYPDSDVLKRLISRGIDYSRIYMTKATEAIGVAYRAAAVCVIPSERNESFCRVAAESLGLGLHVVVGCPPKVGPPEMEVPR